MGKKTPEMIYFNLDDLVKSPSAALRFNFAPLDKDLGLLTE
jgi:hypothetical protein